MQVTGVSGYTGVYFGKKKGLSIKELKQAKREGDTVFIRRGDGSGKYEELEIKKMIKLGGGLWKIKVKRIDDNRKFPLYAHKGGPGGRNEATLLKDYRDKRIFTDEV